MVQLHSLGLHRLGCDLLSAGRVFLCSIEIEVDLRMPGVLPYNAAVDDLHVVFLFLWLAQGGSGG